MQKLANFFVSFQFGSLHFVRQIGRNRKRMISSASPKVLNRGCVLHHICLNIVQNHLLGVTMTSTCKRRTPRESCGAVTSSPATRDGSCSSSLSQGRCTYDAPKNISFVRQSTRWNTQVMSTLASGGCIAKAVYCTGGCPFTETLLGQAECHCKRLLLLAYHA